MPRDCSGLEQLHGLRMCRAVGAPGRILTSRWNWFVRAYSEMTEEGSAPLRKRSGWGLGGPELTAKYAAMYRYPASTSITRPRPEWPSRIVMTPFTPSGNRPSRIRSSSGCVRRRPWRRLVRALMLTNPFFHDPILGRLGNRPRAVHLRCSSPHTTVPFRCRA